MGVYDSIVSNGLLKWLLPIAIFVTTAFEIFILSTFTSTIGLGLSIAVGIIGIGTILSLLLIKGKEKLKQFMSLIAILGMLIAPYTGQAHLFFTEETVCCQRLALSLQLQVAA